MVVAVPKPALSRLRRESMGWFARLRSGPFVMVCMGVPVQA